MNVSQCFETGRKLSSKQIGDLKFPGVSEADEVFIFKLLVQFEIFQGTSSLKYFKVLVH